MSKPLPGAAPHAELFKTEFSHVNFCSINPDDMSNIAIVSPNKLDDMPFSRRFAQESRTARRLLPFCLQLCPLREPLGKDGRDGPRWDKRETSKICVLGGGWRGRQGWAGSICVCL